MHDELIRKVADLMSEQSAAYARLESAGTQLSLAMVVGEPNSIESLTRIGEMELMRMRVCLLKITSALTLFAETRAQQVDRAPLNPEAREKFETSAKSLMDAAKSFQKISSKAANLAVGGSSFTSACVQMCGVPPTTYRAPVLKYYEGGLR